MGAVALHWRVPDDAAAPGPGRFLVLALVLVVAAVIHAIVFLFPQWYPQTYDDQGLTRFKIASEYGVVALYAASLGVLLHWARERAAFDVARLFAAVWVMALSEFFFTFYVVATDPFNLLGPVYKVVGYYYLYRAIFVGTIEAPYRVLKQSDKAMRAVLDAVPDLGAYVPLDISETALLDAATRIRADYPNLTVQPALGDFEQLAPLPEDWPRGRRIRIFPGSTIGNLQPDEAEQFLAAARRMLGEGALFILGVDLVKDPAILVAAYDDSQGVTAAFNRNLLVRANAELDADFDLDAFTHRAVWNPEASRMEMHLQAITPTTVRIGDQSFRFMSGETIHTESSHKFTPDTVEAMAKASGWSVVRTDVSPEPNVALALLRA